LVDEATRYRENVNRESQLMGINYLTQCQRTMEDLYQQVWYNQSMDDALEKAVNDAVNDAKNKFGNWTKIKFLYNSESQKEIQDYILYKIMNRFTYDYEIFMDNFLTIYTGEVKGIMEAYAKELKDLRMNEAQFLAGYREISNQALDPVMAAVAAGMDMPNIPAVFSGGNLIGTGSAFSLFALRKVLQRSIQKKIVGKLASGLGQKVLGLTRGPVGWVVTIGLVGRDIYDIGKTVWNVPEKLAEHFNDSLREAYFDNAPDGVWDSVSLDVKNLIDSVPAMMASYDIAVQELTVCEDYRDLAESLPPSDQDLLLKKLLLLKNRTGADFCRIAGTLGAPVSQISTGNIFCVAAAMNEMSLEIVSQWLHKTGNDFCKLRELPDEAWTKYSSTLENIDILRWLSGLPKNFQKIGAALPQETARWMMTNLNTTDQVLVFKNRTLDAVTFEIARLMKSEQKMVQTTVSSENDTSGYSDEKNKSIVHTIKDFPKKIMGISDEPGQEKYKLTAVVNGVSKLMPAWVFWAVVVILGFTLFIFIFRWVAWLKKILGAAVHDWKIGGKDN
jgi:hypothetical protein